MTRKGIADSLQASPLNGITMRCSIGSIQHLQEWVVVALARPVHSKPNSMMVDRAHSVNEVGPKHLVMAALPVCAIVVLFVTLEHQMNTLSQLEAVHVQFTLFKCKTLQLSGINNVSQTAPTFGPTDQQVKCWHSTQCPNL